MATLYHSRFPLPGRQVPIKARNTDGRNNVIGRSINHASYSRHDEFLNVCGSDWKELSRDHFEVRGPTRDYMASVCSFRNSGSSTVRLANYDQIHPTHSTHPSPNQNPQGLAEYRMASGSSGASGVFSWPRQVSNSNVYSTLHAPVAQLDRVTGFNGAAFRQLVGGGGLPLRISPGAPIFPNFNHLRIARPDCYAPTLMRAVYGQNREAKERRVQL